MGASSGAVFLPSKLQKIVIHGHQKNYDITVYLGNGEKIPCPLPSRANDNGMKVVVRFFNRKEFASSHLLHMPFVKIAFDVRQDELSVDEFMVWISL